MGEIVSKSEFARRRGVDPAAVSMWIARGQIWGSALTADGKVDEQVAIEQLRQKLDPARSLTPLDDLGGNGAGDSDVPHVSASLIDQQRSQRIEEAALRLRRLRAEENERAGKYMVTTNVEREWNRLLGQLVDETEAWIADLVQELGGGAEELAIARQSWRKFRQRQAENAEAEMNAQPRLMVDAA